MDAYFRIFSPQPNIKNKATAYSGRDGRHVVYHPTPWREVSWPLLSTYKWAPNFSQHDTLCNHCQFVWVMWNQTFPILAPISCLQKCYFSWRRNNLCFQENPFHWNSDQTLKFDQTPLSDPWMTRVSYVIKVSSKRGKSWLAIPRTCCLCCWKIPLRQITLTATIRKEREIS